jgi:hypothetical protein
MPVVINFGFKGFLGGEGSGRWIDGILIASYWVKDRVKSIRSGELAIALRLNTRLVPTAF